MAEAFAAAPVDIDRLRAEVKLKYRDVATDPTKGFHFHTGRPLAKMLDYPMAVVDVLPDQVVESFAGVRCETRQPRTLPVWACAT